MLPGFPGSEPKSKEPYQRSPAIIVGVSQKTRTSKGWLAGTLLGPVTLMFPLSASGTTTVTRVES